MKRHPKASVVIAARNNGQFLAEAILSALSQSIPVEVVYSDDCSSDDSINVARQFADQITILRSPLHRGVCAARNAGASAAKTNRLVFLDGDDRLPEDFVEKQFQAMSPGTPFAYPKARIFGDHPMDGHTYQIPEWKDYDQWRKNTCNTSCLHDAATFWAAGGWRDGVGTMWDYDLALRCARFGEPRPSQAVLDYRHHGESWSDAMQERTESHAIQIREEVRRLNVRLAIVCIYSGRLPSLVNKWASNLANSVRRARLEEPVEILVLDNSQGSELEDELLCYSEVFSRIQIVPHKFGFSWTTESERRDGVAKFLADASNRAMSLVKGDVVWFVEDDILVPMNACDSLLRCLVSGECPVQAVSGMYLSRHKTGKYIAGIWDREKLIPEEFDEAPKVTTPVDVAGTGCLMFWRTRTGMPKEFKSHIGRTPAHDWAWCRDAIALGGKILMDPSVRCGHAVSETEIL